MAMNHSLSSSIPEEALWWQQLNMNTQPTPTSLDAVPAPAATVLCPAGASTFSFNGTRGVVGEHQHSVRDDKRNLAAAGARGDEDDGMIEPMFEKPLTPSDVGKLNRLVIPKQHAEKYLPLGCDSAADKGQLLSFEDESGKPWRFRYSYWNSSQSYVLTKGWSRFVKEKRLDAGDVILFLKHSRCHDRLFIGCRRRDAAAARAHDSPAPPPPGFYYTPPYTSRLLPCQAVDHCPRSVPSSAINHATVAPPTAGKSKRLRLFGVNLEWQPGRFDSAGSDDSPISAGVLAHQQLYAELYSSNHHNNIDMDVNFARDVNHQTMVNRRG